MDATVTRVLLVAVLVAVALVVAFVLRRRQPDPPTGASSLPAQLDRDDFDRPAAPWLVVIFSSETCDSCAGVVARAEPLRSDAVVVQDVPYQTRRDLHTRYAVDAVPTVLIADAEGVVRSSHVGPVTSAELWASMAEVRG